MKKHQRYFFKGDKKMSKLKEANDLVDIAFDESFEVFGKIKKAEKKMEKLLDMCRKPHNEEDDIDFGKGTIDTTGRPYDHPKKVRVTADVEECDMSGMPAETEEEYMDTYKAAINDVESDEPNDIDHVPDQDVLALYKSVRKQLGEIKRLNEDAKAEYKKYFDSMLKKYGVTSPAQLDTAKKKEFFDAVDRGWKAKKETD
jgi:hypothetical protein